VMFQPPNVLIRNMLIGLLADDAAMIDR
jgi:hypothetical protein